VLSINRSAPQSVFLLKIQKRRALKHFAVIESPIPVTSCFETGEGSIIIIVYVILAVAEIRGYSLTTLFLFVIESTPPEIWLFTLYKAVTSYWREGTHNRLLERLVYHNVVYMTCGLRELPSH
jgi:hypothetical protein